MPIIPILTAVLPGLIHFAEKAIVGDGKGAEKKSVVLSLIEKFYDAIHLERIFPDIDGVDEKKFFLDLVSVAIDHLAPVVTKKMV